MSSRVAAVIRCGNQIDNVYVTVESVRAQTARVDEIVLAVDDTISSAGREWLSRFASDEGLAVVQAAAATPAVLRNAAVTSTRSELLFFVDAGDRLDPRYCESAATEFNRDAAVAIVTSAVQILGPGSRAEIVCFTECGLPDLAANTNAIHGASLFSRAAWQTVGGFDESLAALEDYDLWLRVLIGGSRCTVLPGAMLIRRLRRAGLYRQEWNPSLHAASMEQIAHKHPAAFAATIADALWEREMLLQRLESTYRECLTRRDQIVAAIAADERRVQELRSTLPEHIRDGVDLGDLRRTSPVSRDWGYDRGAPIDRPIIEEFIELHRGDIRGLVLEVQEADYTQRFGDTRVTRSDVADVNTANSRATIVTDLRAAANIRSDTYDCIILTQTLHVIADMRKVVAECARILRPGGVLLATLPCVSRVCLEYGDEGDFWRLTEAGARNLFAQVFPETALDIRSRGNILAATAFLYGLGAHELSRSELGENDPYFPLIVTVRAVKPERAGSGKAGTAGDAGTARSGRMAGRTAGIAGGVLLYHRIATPPSDVHDLSVDPNEFRDQMRILRDEFEPVTLERFIETARNGQATRRQVAVTFDDGYLDNYEVASPILQEFEIPATFFVTTERLSRDRSTRSARSMQADDETRAGYQFWWDSLERALHREPAEHWRQYHAIVGLPAGERDERVNAIARQHACENSWPIPRRMNAAEITALAALEGHTVGAHTVRHLHLPRQPVDVQRREISDSRETLERLLGRPVTCFAYPFGAFDASTVAAVREAGFRIAVTCETVALDGDVDNLLIPRFAVGSAARRQFRQWIAQCLNARRATAPREA